MPSASTVGLVQTVLEAVRPEELGPTTTHEHLLIDFLCMFNPPTEASEYPKAFQPVTMENLAWVRYDPFRNQDNLLLGDVDTAIAEANLFRLSGGGTIVDTTTIGIGRDPRALARIARATGLNIVMGAGYYVGDTHPSGIGGMTESDLTDEMVADITSGVGATGVKAGIIGELGCSWPLTDNERKVLRAGARAQREAGAAITIHPGRNPAAPAEILDTLAEAGADLSRVVMGHMERTIADVESMLDLARRGCYLEFDLFGWETSYYPLSEMDMASDAQRMNFVKRLVDEGYAERVVIAHDVFAKSRLVKYGGHGYAHILDNIVPRMLARGISQADMDSILVGNPARLLPLARPG
jgi:phosphotriesterase-related protein